MGRPFVDISGQTFGRLKVLRYTRRKNSYTMFMCECECGNTKEVSSHHLKRGNTISCGCYQKEKNQEKKHGETGTKSYKLWSQIKQWCYNPKNQSFNKYGEKGIKVCNEWHDYTNFKEWLIESGYEDGMFVERIDVNCDYSPNNCVLVPLHNHLKKRKSNIFLEYEGKKKNLSEWADEVGVNYRTILGRYRRGIRPPELFIPSRPKNNSSLIGEKFGRLTVVERVESDKHNNVRLKCICECGNYKIVNRNALATGKTVSCGCYNKEAISKRVKTHGNSKMPEYSAIISIIGRCENPKNPEYKNYGGRGITVCERWRKSPGLFVEDMGERPSPNHSIDRIDVNGNYEPSNCRWATLSEQGHNKRVSERSSTGVTGVGYDKKLKKYRAYIRVKGKDYRSKRFDSIEDAIQARKELEEEHLKSS
ncbi:hypothetical protein [Bacillus mycoides]